jgi:protease YdgD
MTRRGILGALSLLMGLLAALPAPAQQPPARPGIVGRDDRRPLQEAEPALAAVGRVNREGGGFCTGVLIAPDRTLTAAHCLWDRQRRRLLAADRLHFVAGWRRGTHAGHARAKAIEHEPGLRFGAEGAPADPLADWAVLVLNSPIAGPGLRPLPFAGAGERAQVAAGAPMARVGYGRDRPHLPVIVEPCHSRGTRAQGRLLLHDCDATLGDSGSPLLVRTVQGYAVLGLQTMVLEAGSGPVAAALVVGRLQELPSEILTAGSGERR